MRTVTLLGVALWARVGVCTEVGCYEGPLENYEDCTASPQCCPASTSCFRKSVYYAGCLSSCTKGMVDNFDSYPWECVNLEDCKMGLPDQEPLDNRFVARSKGRLRLNGVDLVDEHGDPVYLTGLSSDMLNVASECITRDSLLWIAYNWGINAIQVSISALEFEGKQGFATNSSTKELVYYAADMAEEAGIYAIISLDLVDASPSSVLTQALSFWEETARRYKDKKHVLYDIAGQPSTTSWTSLVAYHNSVVAKIRESDPSTVIIAATPSWNQNLQAAKDNPVQPGANVMYAAMFSAAQDTPTDFENRIDAFVGRLPIFLSRWKPASHEESYGPDLVRTKEILDKYGGVTGRFGRRKLSWVMRAFTDRLGPRVNTLIPNGCRNRQWDTTTCLGTFIRNYIRFAQRLEITLEPTSSPVTDSPTSVGNTRSPSKSPTLSPPTASPEQGPPLPDTPPPVSGPGNPEEPDPQPSPSPSPQSDSQQSKTAILVGGAVGGTMLIGLAAFLITWKVQRRTGVGSLPSNGGRGKSGNKKDKNSQSSLPVASPIPGPTTFRQQSPMQQRMSPPPVAGVRHGSPSPPSSWSSLSYGSPAFGVPVEEQEQGVYVESVDAPRPWLGRAREIISSRMPVFAFIRGRMSTLRGRDSFEARARAPSV